MSNMTPQVFLPEATTIGMLGGGQLGRMFTFVAQRMGYRVHVFSPEADSPACQAANAATIAGFEDTDSLTAFAQQVDVVTLEFENIPVESLELLEQYAPVRPGPNVLKTAQHRIREKRALSSAGFPVANFSEVRSLDDLVGCFVGASATHQFPSVLKTASWGYDGKGQSKITAESEIESAWSTLDCDHAVLEAFVDFQCELSVIVARSSNGEVACYEPIRNEHRSHILDLSISPAGLSNETVQQAKELASNIAQSLDVIGVVCVEMFLTTGGELVVNELAPRPHNSGHLTIEAHATSQFEQQLRAICGLPLGSTEQIRPAAMLNLLGDVWCDGQPDFASVAGLPGAYLHLYGKAEPRVGRKMGHVTVLGRTDEQVAESIGSLRNLLLSRTCTLEQVR